MEGCRLLEVCVAISNQKQTRKKWPLLAVDFLRRNTMAIDLDHYSKVRDRREGGREGVRGKEKDR